MMHLNTHEAYKKLIDAGLKDKVAETIIKVIDEARKSDFDRLATKEDLKDTRNELKLEITNVRMELKEEIAKVRTELKEDIANVRIELKEDIANIKADIADLKGKFGTMQWMMGFLLAMSSAILLKLFLGH